MTLICPHILPQSETNLPRTKLATPEFIGRSWDFCQTHRIKNYETLPTTNLDWNLFLDEISMSNYNYSPFN
jgi:hypothetical protein